jgi:hypothetical protein
VPWAAAVGEDAAAVAVIHGVLKDAIELPSTPDGEEGTNLVALLNQMSLYSPALVIIGVAARQRETVVKF